MVQSMMKTREDNDMTDHTSAIYVENEIELLWPIKLGMACDENQIGQWLDPFYRSSLHWKWYWIVETYRNECGLWQDQIGRDRLYYVIYVKIETELSRPIESGVVCYEN